MISWMSLKIGHVGSKTKLLGQMIEEPVFVSRRLWHKSLSLILYHTIWEAKVRDLRAIMALLLPIANYPHFILNWCELDNTRNILDWSNFSSLPHNPNFNYCEKVVFKNIVLNSLKLEFVYGKIENIVEKGENAGYQHFLLFPQCF